MPLALTRQGSLAAARHPSLRSGLRLAALYFALSSAALTPGQVLADVAVPPVARVTDLTGTLDASQRATLEQKLAAFEQRKGSQVAVLIVPTTEPETIEQYGIRVGEAWKLGRKGVDDGVILLVAKNDRALRIEVGYGLEGAIPDAIARRIVDETITPYFRAGNFVGGIDVGVDQIMKVIDGEPLPPPKRTQQSRRSRVKDPIGTLFFIGVFMLTISRVVGAAIGEVPSSIVTGGAFGLIAWFLVGVATIAGAVGFLYFVVSLIVQLSPSGGGRGGWSSGGGSFGGGGFSSGGSFGGGSFGGGSFGGGGFSGGGGGFGGGGASGRW